MRLSEETSKHCHTVSGHVDEGNVCDTSSITRQTEIVCLEPFITLYRGEEEEEI